MVIVSRFDSSNLNFSLPLYKIVGKALLGEFPVLVHDGRHLECVLPWEDSQLKDAASVDERRPCQGVDVHRIAVVWAQQFVHRMHHTELPVRRNHERLDHRVCVQPRKTLRKLSALVSRVAPVFLSRT